MKKSLLALAVLGAFAGAASAQSSVTLFGVIDQAIVRQSSSGSHLTEFASNQLSSNRLGFKGAEDLGGGLSAQFWLEAGMATQTGQGADASGGLYFNRQSTVSLVSAQAGEVRVGHDYDPTFWNLVFFDVFGANGLGEGLNLVNLGGLGSGAATAVRVNNSVSYFLPKNLGGLYGQVQGASQNGTVTAASSNKYYGGRIGWAGYGLDVAGAYGDTKTPSYFGSDYKTGNVGASYDFGLAKIYALYNQQKVDIVPGYESKLQTEELSAGIPIGLGALNLSYVHASYGGILSGSANQYGIQFLYNVSKRTTLYAGAAQISNKGKADFNFSVDAASIPVNPGASITGYNAGIRHSF
jgi:predicted porin